MALCLPGPGSVTTPCPRPAHRKATSCPAHFRVQMRVGERDIAWTLCQGQLEMVFSCVTECGTDPVTWGRPRHAAL